MLGIKNTAQAALISSVELQPSSCAPWSIITDIIHSVSQHTGHMLQGVRSPQTVRVI